MRTLTSVTMAGPMGRPGNETYFPSVDEARAWRTGIVLAIALGFASFVGQITTIVLLVVLLAEVNDLSRIEGQLIQPIVSMASFRVL